MGRAFEYRKATKFARWDKMAKQFTKAGRQIAIAVKSGGADPDTNILLRRAIQNARSVQMPNAKIDGAIKKASDKDTSNFDTIFYEGMGPNGVAVIIETATDNSVRTVANVRMYFRKKGGSLGTSGMHSFLFDNMGVFYIKEEHIEDPDMFELEFIDFGLESIEKEEIEEEQVYKISVAFEAFGAMQDALEENKIKVNKSGLERIPKITKELAEEQMDEVLDLIDVLEEDDDVVSVFHNLA